MAGHGSRQGSRNNRTGVSTALLSPHAIKSHQPRSGLLGASQSIDAITGQFFSILIALQCLSRIEFRNSVDGVANVRADSVFPNLSPPCKSIELRFQFGNPSP